MPPQACPDRLPVGCGRSLPAEEAPAPVGSVPTANHCSGAVSPVYLLQGLGNHLNCSALISSFRRIACFMKCAPRKILLAAAARDQYGFGSGAVTSGARGGTVLSTDGEW